MRFHRIVLSLAAAAALAGACGGEEFAPISRLDKLRVLALQAEPVNPAVGTSTVLTPLVYAPSGQPSTFAWSWCPLLGDSSDGFSCPLTDAEVQALATELGATEPPPPLDLGTAEQPSYKNVFPPEVLKAICDNGVGGARPNCEHGFPVRVKVTVTNATESLVATVVLRLPTDASAPSNANPTIAGFDAIVAGETVVVDDSGTVELPRLVETELRARIDAANSEPYPDVDEDTGQPKTSKERLVISWFTEQGDLGSSQTGFIDGLSPFDEMLENTIEPLTKKDDPADTARIFLVLRDNRGGVSWTSGTVKLGVSP